MSVPVSTLHGDWETGSPVELRSAGVHRYAEHPATHIWCFAFAFNDSDPHVWHNLPGQGFPREVLDHVALGGRFVAHGAMFERTIWNRVLLRDVVPGGPPLLAAQMDCTIARCAAMAIPEKLEIVAQVLGLTQRKDIEGGALMMRMARPRTRTPCPSCQGTPRRGCNVCAGIGEIYSWWDDWPRRYRLGEYCKQDVRTEVGVDHAIPQLHPAERMVWLLDQEINDRGVMVDVPMVEKMIEVVAFAKKRLDSRMRRLTGGAVTACSQATALARWITDRGVPCHSVAKGEQDELILAAREEASWEPGQPMPEIERAIELRKIAGKASTAKLRAMLACVCRDGRARGQIHYHGASNGRFAGRLIQPHNLYRVDAKRDGSDIEHTREIVRRSTTAQEAHMLIEMIIGPPMVMVAKCLRSMFIASPF